MLYGQVYNSREEYSGKAGYIQVGTDGLGIPQVLDRMKTIKDFGIVLYGEYRHPDRIFDGIYQSDLLYLLNDTDKPVYGAVVHPPTRKNNYYDFVSLMKSLNRETHGFVAVENRCRVGAGNLPLYYVTTPFEVRYFMDTQVPLWVDVMALFVACRFSNDLLVKYMRQMGEAVGYHFTNLRVNIEKNKFKVVNSLKRGNIDYTGIMPYVNPDAYVTLEIRGKKNFEEAIKWIENR